MPVSEKEIIERLPDWIAEKKTSFLFGSGTSAPGMPLMNMFPGKKDGSTDVDGLMYEIIKRNKFLIGAKMKINVSEEESKAILGTLGAYKKFIEILLDMLGNVNARERHKNINIFSLIMICLLKKQLMIFMRVDQLPLLYSMMVLAVISIGCWIIRILILRLLIKGDLIII
jgi:hypothetical protein